MDPPHHALRRIPTPAFVSLNFLAPLTPELQSAGGATPLMASTYYNNGPSMAIYNIAHVVSFQGQILPIQAPGVNSSYSLRFAAPTLQCSDIEGLDRQAIASSFTTQYNYTQQAYPYLAWTYQWSGAASSTNTTTASSPLLPFRKIGSSYGDYEINPAKLDSLRRKPSVIYFATFSDVMSASAPTNYNSSRSTFIKCEMFNSTLETNITFVNGEQNVKSAVTGISDTVVTGVHNVIWYDRDPSCPIIFRTEQDKYCSFDESLPSTLSYVAIFEAFTSLVGGSIYIPAQSAYQAAATNIIDTVLINSPEMRYAKSGLYYGTLQNNLRGSNESIFRGFGRSPFYNSEQPQPLAQALETMFTNIVISSITTASLQ